MIVVLVVAILAAIAYPSYQDSVRKARRADAAEVLMRIAQAQERHFTQYGRYASSLGGAVNAQNLGMSAAQLESEGGHSTVALSNPGATSYTLTANMTPADPDCGNLQIDQRGVKDVTKGGADVDDCWY
jgi:type IV pilus assembly protein PilE